jgi:HEAT repeat protein
VSQLRRHQGEALLPYLQVLRASGEPSVLPALRQELKSSRAAGRVGAARALGFFSMGNMEPAEWSKFEVAEWLLPAFHDLLALLQDADAEVRGEAACALAQIDPARAGPALPHLIARLQSSEVATRRKVVILLARMGPAADSAVGALVQLLTDPDVRPEAALALVNIHATRAGPAVAVLVDLFKQFVSPEAVAPADRAALEERLRSATPFPANLGEEVLLGALGRMGSAAAAAVPTLRQALYQPDSPDGRGASIRTSAASALWRVAPELTQEAVAALIGVVEEAVRPDDGDWTRAWSALDALAELGPAAGEIVPRLEAILLDEKKRFLLGGRVFFVPLVKIDANAVPRLLARLETDLQSNDRFDKAINLLYELGPDIPPTWTPLLERLLQDRRAESRWEDIRLVRQWMADRAAAI